MKIWFYLVRLGLRIRPWSGRLFALNVKLVFFVFGSFALANVSESSQHFSPPITFAGEQKEWKIPTFSVTNLLPQLYNKVQIK